MNFTSMHVLFIFNVFLSFMLYEPFLEYFIVIDSSNVLLVSILYAVLRNLLLPSFNELKQNSKPKTSLVT